MIRMIAPNSTTCCQVKIYTGKSKNKKYHAVDAWPRVSNTPEQIQREAIVEMRLNGKVDHDKLTSKSFCCCFFGMGEVLGGVFC